MRGPDAMVAIRGSAVRHWRDKANIRLRVVVVNPLRMVIAEVTIA